jgi:sRNA-binding protein
MTEKIENNSSKNNELKAMSDSKEFVHQKKGKNYFLLSSEEYNKVLEALSQKYPKLFIKDRVLIFKKGIHKDIFEGEESGFSKSVIRKFLRLYTEKSKYRELHIENTPRYDLKGNEAGVVTKEDVQSLKKQQEERGKIIAAKKLKKKELKNNKAKEEKNSTSKDQKSSSHSKANNDTKVMKSTVTEDNIGNIKSNNSRKPKLGLKK